MDASLIVAAVVVCVAAAVQGLTGTGFGLTAVPPLIVVAPELVPDTVLLLTIAVTGYTAWVERRCIDRTFVRRCVCAAIPGTAVGYAATMLLPARALGIGIAVVVVAAGCAGLAGPRLSVAVPNVWIAGFAAGAFNWVAALPGPRLRWPISTPRARPFERRCPGRSSIYRYWPWRSGMAADLLTSMRDSGAWYSPVRSLPEPCWRAHW